MRRMCNNNCYAYNHTVGPCTICQENIENKTQLQCGHTFCRDCIAKWLGECDHRCPTCRAPAITMSDSAGNKVHVPVTTANANG